MSGSGGGGYGGSGGHAQDCNIVERVPLNSVQPAALTQLSVGQVLDVVLLNGTLIARTSGGTDAGSLTPQALADLLDCIDRGHQYKAHVLTIKGAFVEVEIRPK